MGSLVRIDFPRLQYIRGLPVYSQRGRATSVPCRLGSERAPRVRGDGTPQRVNWNQPEAYSRSNK